MTNHIIDTQHPMPHKQPRALIGLFLTELWERFSYWSLYALLTLYMIHALDFSDATAYLTFGTFNGLLYASPIIGGWLADRYLSATRTMIHGAVWLIAGYVVLALSHNALHLYLGMGLLIWGNGLFNPNVATVLGACYQRGDIRRQQGFTIYYMGINIGAILGILLCGWLSTAVSWNVAYGVVAIAMLIGTLNYLICLPGIRREMVQQEQHKPRLKHHSAAVIGGVAVSLPMACLLQTIQLANIMLGVGVIGLVLYLTYTLHQQSTEHRQRSLMCLTLTSLSVAFWTLYMQMGSSLTTYTERWVNLNWGSYHLTAPMISSVNGFWLLALSPLLVRLWRLLAERDRAPRTETLFLWGMIAMCLGYATLCLSAWLAPAQGQVSLNWVLGSYGLQTLGELCISPIGLAMITEIAPVSCQSLLMGVWFLATAVASVLSGPLAELAAPSGVHHTISNTHLYVHAFGADTLMAVVAVIILIACRPWIRSLRTVAPTLPSAR